jgi:acyl-CoA synthetase (AMP-forming)/AMP-acid ligase II
MPVQTIRRLRERLPWVETRNFFGLTETTSVTHVLPAADALARGDSVGKALPDVGVMIADEEGRPLPAGEIGELCIRRENVVPGYWNRPGLLEESIRDGWFHTGDLAMEDDQGYLYLRGRSKDMIIVGGENVYANEVEAVIMSHGKVMECAVIGIEATGVRAYLGELVKAVVVVEDGADLSEAEIKRHCAQHLASYKVPQVVEFRAELPRNPSGKVLKRDLK